MRNYACDFEATTTKYYEKEGQVRVWAWQARDIESLNIEAQGTSIDTYMEWLTDINKTITAYFHNLKYDGNFIIDYLLNNGWELLEKDEKQRDKSFRTLITEQGSFFEIEIFVKVYETRQTKVVIRDSIKKIPISIESISKAFEVGKSKGSIDFNAPRPINYEPSELEWEYIGLDTLILATALKEVLESGMNRITIAGDALRFYKQSMDKDMWKILFPILSRKTDDFIRASYRGGYVYLKPEYVGHTFNTTNSYDVNSLFSSIMYREELPHGLPKRFKNEYKYDKKYPLYIQKIFVDFDLRDGYLPTIQAKHNPIYQPTEYITNSDGELLELNLTSVDLELFLEHHNIYHIEYAGGLKFKSSSTMFTDYVEHWYWEKEGNTGGRRQMAKLMLNSLYGKFGTRIERRTKEPYLEDGVVKYKTVFHESSKPVYTAVASFITSYARRETITAAQNNFDRFIYADTDSIHLIGHEEAIGIRIHDTSLGAWAQEGNFGESKFLRAKTYIKKTEQDELEIVCSGLPDISRDSITFDNFKLGATFEGKLTNHVVRGGSVLKETNFTIHDV